VNATNYTVDDSGMGNNGQVIGGAALTPDGKFGAGMQFDGVNDYVSLTSSLPTNYISNFTISGWFNVFDISSTRTLFYQDTYKTSVEISNYFGAMKLKAKTYSSL